MIPIATPKGNFHVWTKRVGHNPRIRSLLLHGGPGATHEYFEAFEQLLPGRRHRVHLLRPARLGVLRPAERRVALDRSSASSTRSSRCGQALGLDQDNFYLLGHSWGGILAVEYALAHQEHLKGLVISNMMMSIPDYNSTRSDVLAKPRWTRRW